MANSTASDANELWSRSSESDSGPRRVARVIVDLSIDRAFDYLVPEALSGDVMLGSRVTVDLGHGRRTGYVVRLLDRSDVPRLKPILEVSSSNPYIPEDVLSVATWMATYYLAPVERAIRAVLPAPVRRRTEAFKKERWVAPALASGDWPAGLEKKAPKQAKVLAHLCEHGETRTTDLTAITGATASVIKTLADKGWVKIREAAAYRNPFRDHVVLPTQPLPLMPQQAEALALCFRAIDTREPPVVLLNGVTGSGKTEVYLQAIAHARTQGKTAIVLVPEIALTPQTVDRFRSRFGDCVAVLHSELSEGERHDEWHRIRRGEAEVVIGARSALFAPLARLGLIIVDEEHEPTYKQEELPKYNARDVAVVRGRISRCPVLLGTATPSLETYQNVLRKRYAMARMPHRVDHRKMPLMRIVDMRTEADKEGKLHIFSRDLIDAIEQRLTLHEQTILFLNRRGYSSSLICMKCGHVCECPECSISMTYHKTTEKLLCHLCGHEERVPAACPSCRDPAFKFTGVGTQRIEEITRKLFSRATVVRMDSDTMTRKDAYRTVLGDFRSGKIDILIGTQMIAKGLHFPNVTLVGVMFADLSLHMPDFRAAERTYQLLTQVAGRAGRGDVVGEVIVQTFSPQHWAIQSARRLDYETFADQELAFREELMYPPHAHLVCITAKGKSERRVSWCLQQFADQLQPRLGKGVILSGPAPAPLARIKGHFRFQLVMRAAQTREITGPLKTLLFNYPWPPDVQVATDVDAVSMG